MNDGEAAGQCAHCVRPIVWSDSTYRHSSTRRAVGGRGNSAHLANPDNGLPMWLTPGWGNAVLLELAVAMDNDECWRLAADTTGEPHRWTDPEAVALHLADCLERKTSPSVGYVQRMLDSSEPIHHDGGNDSHVGE